MRNYWLKIVLGALGIFAIGMIGVTIVRSGIAKVNSVVEGDGPISIPLGLIPFVLGGERLGKLDHVTLNRDAPNVVSDVELTVDLIDSLLAQGLSGCRLAANFEGDQSKDGVHIKVGKDHEGTFECLREDSTPAHLTEYGVAIFRPGDIEVPLLLPTEMVAELQSLDFGDDSTQVGPGDSIQVPNADSIRASVAREIGRADSIRSFSNRFADSVRAEARRQWAELEDSQ
jgi:hypothetical protein